MTNDCLNRSDDDTHEASPLVDDDIAHNGGDIVRVAIGTEPKTNIPLKVLKYSLQKYCSKDIEFIDLMGQSWESKDKALLPTMGTGFSLQRWYIPELCDNHGLCLYLDVDILCFEDIHQLFQLKLNNKSIACTYQKDKWFQRAPATSVMLIDCQLAKEQWRHSNSQLIYDFLKNDPTRSKYVALMHAQYCFPQPLEIPLKWNRFNHYIENDTALLHYTKENEQPWYYPQHPFKNLWRDALIETMEAGLITKEEIELELSRFKPHTNRQRGQGLHPYWRKFLGHCVT